MEVVMSEGGRTRGERLQIMLTPEELVLIDDFRFKHRMPSRAAAVREILTRGLSAMGFAVPRQKAHSAQFGVSSNRRLKSDD
jgi:hypothetical protein